MEKRHVFLGAGTASVNAIRTMRQMGCDDPVVLIAKEPPYSRMVLPYYLERGISEGHTQTLSFDQLEQWGVLHRFGRRVKSLDGQGKCVVLDNDESVSYDNLVIATGSSAVKPPIAGVDLPMVHRFWTMEDAQRVHALLKPDSRAVMVGAGFISFTILNGVLKRSASLTVVEAEPRILPRMIDATGAGLVHEWLKGKGVTFFCGQRLERIEARGERAALTFSDGGSVDADLVIMATGVKPNLDWAQGSGLTIDHGILVNDKLESNLDNVYAAGDVAQGANRIDGKQEVHAIETTAMEHGRVIGANLAGKTTVYKGSLLMNIVGVAGLDAASFGAWNDASAEVIEATRPERYHHRKLLLKNNRLMGVILVSPSHETWAGNEMGMLKGLVQVQAPLGEWAAKIKEDPFHIKPFYLSQNVVGQLLPESVLPSPSLSPRSM